MSFNVKVKDHKPKATHERFCCTEPMITSTLFIATLVEDAAM